MRSDTVEHRGARTGSLAAVVVAALLLGACAGPGTPRIEPGGQPGAGGVAPDCVDVEPLVAHLPDGHPAAAPDAPDGRGDDRPAGGADDRWLPEEVERWALREAPDSFAGVWLAQDLGGVVAVAFADDVERYASQVRDQVDGDLAVASATTSAAELRDVQERLTQQEMAGPGGGSGAVFSSGIQVMINRVTVGIHDPDDARLAELSATYGADAICFERTAAAQPPAEGVVPLAKVPGWRDGLSQEEVAFAVLEVAADRASAERAWRDNVPDDLEPRDDELPAEPGRYGDLTALDLDRQVLVVWSSGESGSCPEWLDAIDTADGTVRIERATAGPGACTDDYVPYRMVLAVDRDRLPQLDALASAGVDGVPDAELRPYPDEVG